ncbi:hypothetical protein GA0061098_1007157 [Bradyrhizobium shewense]|uniref:Uncharacterized protein n=2 Tax=Bradyrhizobium shewense TaxID=1761772 RepID=A0A1C3WC79_9BRAD|nr:hypothetical protein GA0061098_1007157 [Bradyrhizobium shewense]
MGETSIPQWLQSLISGWPMIKANPVVFILILIAVVSALWIIFSWSYGSVLESKKSQIELLERQISDYKEKLHGASPDQAKAKIDALEQTLKVTVGAKWDPLSGSQISFLTSRLKDIQKSRVSVMYENALGKELAQNIFEAFKQAGWEEAQLGPGGGLGDGIVVGWSSRAVAVKAALESTAKFPRVWAKDTEKEIPDLIIVGVGLNSF